MSHPGGAPLLALGLVNSLLWSLYLLLTRHVVSGDRLDAWAYTLVQLLAAGLVLLWIGRRAAGSWGELLAPWTVGYAFLRVAINGATAASVVWLAVTQSTLLATVSVLIGAGSGWFLTRQPPPKRDWLGLALLAAGIAGFGLALTGEAWRGLVWLGLSETMAVAGSWLIAYHPRNRSTDTAARSRFTGEILVAASLALILVWSLLGLLGVMASPWAGGGDAFGRIELWLYAVLAGLLFRAPGTWLGFWTINHTGVQTYLIALTAMPFFAIALEAVSAWFGWVAPPRLSANEWMAAVIILVASVWLIVIRMKAPRTADP
ncbi:MAG TPA: EamA family transporter [Reyranella sp.]|nr:EamA family transporter [Reyranella sp.]